MFKEAEWIWTKDETPDSYVDFICDPDYSGGGAELRISCDSNYAAYINGKLAAFGQYSDFPHHKIGDKIDISGFLKTGRNRLAIIVWYYGRYGEKMPLTYSAGRAGLIFEVESAGQIIAASGQNTLSRIDPGYRGGGAETITWQLGLGFLRDETRADDAFLTGGSLGFTKSRIVALSKLVSPRPNKKTVLGDRLPSDVIRAGKFKYPAKWQGAYRGSKHVFGNSGTAVFAGSVRQLHRSLFA